MQTASKKYLTIIIPFLNEGEEIVLTVKSVRETAGDDVEIITINDGSDDGYPCTQKPIRRKHVKMPLSSCGMQLLKGYTKGDCPLTSNTDWRASGGH